MLYSILKPIIRLSLKVFFRKIEVIGRENLPEKGPAIIVSNHPSAFIDPLIIVILLKRKLHFIAGGEWFGKGIKSWIFRKQFNMIPVVRPWLQKDKTITNKDMFSECYKSLDRDNCIVIYPEASSVTVSHIRELKTGAVRIKLGFEKFTQGKKTVPIIPVGMNYTDAHSFRSDLIANIGEPILFEQKTSAEDPEQIELARSMTDQIQEVLKKYIVHVENPSHNPLLGKIAKLFVTTLRKDLYRDRPNPEAELKAEQDIVEAIQFFEKNDPEGLNDVSRRIDDYFATADKIGLTDDQVDPTTKKETLSKVTAIILGFPLFCVAGLLNFIPFQITYLTFRKKLLPRISPEYIQGKLNPSFTGSLIFALGMFIFLVWSILFTLAIGFYTGNWIIALAFLLAGYPLLQYSLWYIHQIQEYRVLRKGIKLRNKFNSEIEQLGEERQEIIKILNKFKVKFEQQLDT